MISFRGETGEKDRVITINLFCRFVMLKMPEVALGQLLYTGWVTLGHTTLLPIHHKITTHTSEEAHGFLAIKKIGSPDHIPSYGHDRSKIMQSIYGTYGWSNSWT